MEVNCEMKDGRSNSSPLRNEKGGANPAHCKMKYSIGSELQAIENFNGSELQALAKFK
jgi:hypothetical protein